MKSVVNSIKSFFQLSSEQTSINQELRAGITSFLTMAYIIIVNPIILGQAGMEPNSVLVATCITSAFGCILIGVLANKPLGLAPGMAMNAYFSYEIVKNLGYSWPDAMGLIFISGLLFLLVCITPIKTWILDSIPHNLGLAISCGISLFIAFIAIKSIGLVTVASNGTIQMGQITSQAPFIAGMGLLTIIILEKYKIPGAIILAIILATILDQIINVSAFHNPLMPPPITPPQDQLNSTFFGLSLSNIKFTYQNVEIILTFFFIALFDSAGTLTAILKSLNKTENNKQTSNVLLANSLAMLTGCVLGTTPTSPYVESMAGIKAGGRTGLTAITIGILFLLALFIAPLARIVPIYATAPALLYVSFLMLQHITDIKWQNPYEAIPAGITIVLIPYTFSIADSIGYGIISYCVLALVSHLFSGKTKSLNHKPQLHPMLWVMSIIFIAYFVAKSL